jgi:4-amino-4-deoxy-L-arabinose transferase-like glycosyltransferase
LLIGLVGTLAVLATKDDPGLTSDEPFSASYGKAFVYRLLTHGGSFFTPESIEETFGARSEHPPLGRWAVGWAQWLLDPRPRDPLYFDVRLARIAPAVAFGLLLILVTRRAAVWWGTPAGVAAGVGLGLMPRVFAHAHFAALDTFVSLTYTAAICAASGIFAGKHPAWRAIAAGAVWGLALLAKMHGVLVAPVVASWALLSERRRAVWPVCCWSAAGLATFVAGWPWLWNAPQRMAQFFARSVDRSSTMVWYLGREFRDVDVPWHYPWILFAVTVPVGLLALGAVGLGVGVTRCRWDARVGLVLGAWLFPLVLFSSPRVPVYDGTRLFLMVFPLWALLIGLGTATIARWLAERCGRYGAGAALGVFFAAQAVGVVRYHPCQLSYYNALVGGLSGAERLGFQVTYWGDALTPAWLDRWSRAATAGSVAALAPTLYRDHELLYMTDRMARAQQKLVPQNDPRAQYLIVFNRRPYVGNELLRRIDRLTPVIPPLQIDGVWLAAAYRLPHK